MNRESWRPTTLREFIGQRELVTLLQDEVDASIAHNRAMPHVCLYGASGLGKSALIDAMAASRGVPCNVLMGPMVNAEVLSEALGTLDASGYSRGVVTDRSQVRTSVLCLDEAEAIKLKDFENLHRAIEPGPDGIRKLMGKEPGRRQARMIWVPEFTLALTTNFYGRLNKVASALLNRIPIKWQFVPYEEEEIYQILVQYANRTRTPITDGAVRKIAARSGGIPRTAILLFKQARTRVEAQVHRSQRHDMTIDEAIVEGSAELMRIDDRGLQQQHRQYLEALSTAESGRMGLSSLAAVLCVDEVTIRIDVEPPLIRNQLVQIVPNGRQITQNGLEAIGMATANSIVNRYL